MRLKDEYQEKTEDRIIKRTYGLQSEPAVVWWRESGRWLRLPVNRADGSYHAKERGLYAA